MHSPSLLGIELPMAASFVRSMSNNNEQDGREDEQPEPPQEHSSSSDGERQTKTKHLDPKQYAEAVWTRSQLLVTQSLYAGNHFDSLARFLNSPLEQGSLSSGQGTTPQEPGLSFNFVTFYDLDPATDQRETHISRTEDFKTKAKSLDNSVYGRLIFMNGYPTPEWLLSIGSTYKIDPEYFRRHLDFAQGHRNHYSHPPLPSTLGSALRIQLSTIRTSVAKVKANSEQDALDHMRDDNKQRLSSYRDRIRRLPHDIKLGDSIVRDSSVHDLQNISVEQDASIYVGRCGSGWFASVIRQLVRCKHRSRLTFSPRLGFDLALIWLDTTNSMKDANGPISWLDNPLGGEWWTISSVPVVQHVPGLVLRSKAKLLSKRSNSVQPSSKSLVQSAGLLHLNYGRNLDKHIAANDSFYALKEIFTFASLSENQFLNMLETMLLEELDHARLVRHDDNATISNLLYNQQVLDRHIQQIRSSLAAFQSQDSLDWPRGRFEQQAGKQQKMDDATKSLIQDYEYLLSRADMLSEKCSRGMQVVMNNAAIKESREAISQAADMAKLTRLAFIFVPLSFTASFFGMNFVQISQGDLPLWIWFAVSVPIMLVSMLWVDRKVYGAVSRAFRGILRKDLSRERPHATLAGP
ncbi:hypothetical protein B0T17DRAFT_646595 [Bombardia bombarda]|uniref:Uncharacterized protein n=1 Tax=Bombardia bombarda TaxID=252184 RepID=A0AA40BVG7_9PEZI|nr:hypothetical protein B0T17DRAFT_646595 [Bombardia bombarda]